MSVAYELNGRKVSKIEFYRRTARRVRLHGGIAGMAAARKAPQADTDTSFFANFRTLGQEHGEFGAQHLASIARQHGYTPSPNDVYDPSIAEFPGDPRAFVKSRGEMVRYAEEKGQQLAINGRTVTRHREPERDPFETAPKLDPREAVSMAREELKRNPKLDPREAIEMVTEKHGSPV